MAQAFSLPGLLPPAAGLTGFSDVNHVGFTPKRKLSFDRDDGRL